MDSESTPTSTLPLLDQESNVNHNHNPHLTSRSLLVLFATESGSSQDAADRIARECRRIHFRARVVDMGRYPPESLVDEHLVVFVVSTTGSGAEPRTMTPLWSLLLRSELPTDLFEDLDFAVFGLGDSSYEKFNWPSKKLSRRLSSLGATEICPRGEGDDQHHLGIDGALDPWTERLLESLLGWYPLPNHVEITPPHTLYLPRASLVASPETPVSPHPIEVDERYHTGIIRRNKRITADDWFQDVRHLEFDFEDDIMYAPGDVMVIHPEASSMDVESFLASMGWSNIADDTYTIEFILDDQSRLDHLPEATSLRDLFTRHLDFNAVPRRSFFDLLRHFATDDLEREKLDEFVSTEGAELLYEYCHRVKRTIREVLSEFRSARVPIEYIFDLFPAIRPRQFSIASSVHRHPKQVHLCVAIVRYRTKLKMSRRGLCTTYLASLLEGDPLRVGFQKGVIKLPENPNIPIICIGPGTGVAPMRAVLEERIHRQSHRNTLYFGCRSAAKDQHYYTEWKEHSANADVTYRVACSRDNPEGVKRTYVQDLIREDSEQIWKLVGEENAHVYISGSSNKMPAEVREAIRFSVEKHGGKNEEESATFIANMEQDGRLVEDSWS